MATVLAREIIIYPRSPTRPVVCVAHNPCTIRDPEINVDYTNICTTVPSYPVCVARKTSSGQFDHARRTVYYVAQDPVLSLDATRI